MNLMAAAAGLIQNVLSCTLFYQMSHRRATDWTHNSVLLSQAGLFPLAESLIDAKVEVLVR